MRPVRHGLPSWICTSIAVALLSGCGSGGPGATSKTSSTNASRTSVRHRGAGQPMPTLGRRPRGGPAFQILRLDPNTRVPLRSAPGGAVVGLLGPRTRFGSPQTLSVAIRRGRWMGVSTPLLPNGRLGWIAFDRSRIERYWTRYSIEVALRVRTMTVRYGRDPQHTYRITVGAAASATPPGRFGITDALRYRSSPFYGCCALALSGHQQQLPPGWLGGDRIAIHGTPGPAGGAASHGCIRAANATMRTLFDSVPLGTPVLIRPGPG